MGKIRREVSRESMDKPLVSVIVPAFNMERTIEKCVTAIMKSDYTNLEILLMDDGSTDRTGEICDALEEVAGNVSVYHLSHSGVSNARNEGIVKARGDYITFCDADDYPEKDAYRRMVEGFNGDIALVCGGIRRNISGKTKEVNANAMCVESGDAAYDALLEGKMPGGVWGYMFPKAELVDENGILKHCFSTECVVWEDSLFLCEYFYGTEGKVCNIGDIVYNYISKGTSLKRLHISEDFVKSTYAYDRILSLCAGNKAVGGKAIKKYGFILSKLIFAGMLKRVSREYLDKLADGFFAIEKYYFEEGLKLERRLFSKAVFALYRFYR